MDLFRDITHAIIQSDFEKVTSSFKVACDLFSSGRTVIAPELILSPEIRDRCGFCVPVRLSQSSFTIVTGFTNNPHRPGIKLQRWGDMDFPKGNYKVILPSKNKHTFSPGSFLIDAELFDEFVKELRVA